MHAHSINNFKMFGKIFNHSRLRFLPQTTGLGTQQSSLPQHMLYDLELTKSTKTASLFHANLEKSCKFMAANSNQHKSFCLFSFQLNCIRARQECQGTERSKKWHFYGIQIFLLKCRKINTSMQWTIHPSHLLLLFHSDEHEQLVCAGATSNQQRQLPRWSQVVLVGGTSSATPHTASPWWSKLWDAIRQQSQLRPELTRWCASFHNHVLLHW